MLVVFCRDGRQSTSVVVGLRPLALTPFKRFHTLGASRRRIASQFLSKRPFSTIDLSKDNEAKSLKCDQSGGGVAGKTGGDGPSLWATSFERLLEDPVGLHAFAEFLKKEFSAENIYFWTACERYRRLTAQKERSCEAQRIFKQHLENGAVEAVNVDAQGVQAAEQGLDNPGPDIFDTAQKQIFNLIKFDSYPRFLKSQLYKQCLSGDVFTPTNDARLSLYNNTQSALGTPKLKKSLSNAEDRRRKSLLPWHRKNPTNQRSKSRDRNETQKSWDGVLTIPDKRLASASDIHSSHSSLTSLDLAASQEAVRQDVGPEARTSLCRVLLTNGSTTVVQIREGDSIQQLINRLLEKRGLTYSSYEVFTNKHPKVGFGWNQCNLGVELHQLLAHLQALDITEPSTKLAGCEVTIDQRVVFKLDLPNRKIISVKSKSSKLIIDVLRPILHKYKFSLDEVNVTKAGYPVDTGLAVTTIDNARLNIQLKDESSCPAAARPVLKVNSVEVDKLEEITNKVFEGILQEKSQGETMKSSRSDKGSVKSEDWGSEHSSGLLGKFLRRDSGVHDKKKKIASQRPKLPCESEASLDSNHKKPLIAKLKAGANKLHVAACSESDELVEGLTRAQRRLEDQRGTEINFELPDFLKDKDDERQCGRPIQTLPDTQAKVALTKNQRQSGSPNYENQHITVSSTGRNPVKVPSIRVEVKGPKMDPPPLPPKPKIVPIKPPNWGHAGFYKAKDAPLDKHTEMFLEQPSSSFV
ncbi:hypothetical protein HUJ05_007152 [Dendroctonus ponderosae]|nr:hypothetical protein HUJ05_007152 [Dendroctonus ponderosae]